MAVSRKERILVSTAYFGPVYYYHRLYHAREVFLEQHEHFIKQTWRNRCMILAANGPMPLIVPVEHGRRPGVKIRDIRIAFHTPWQRNHWRSIFSAYKNSPFFDYYADSLHPFFHREYKFLFDLNTEIQNLLLKLMNIPGEVSLTESFEQVDPPFENLREKISPKTDLQSFDPEYKPSAYTQVFEDKFPFIPGLSILDLLFCTGPGSAVHLSQKFPDDDFVIERQRG